MDNCQSEGSTRVREELNPNYVLETLKELDARVKKLENCHTHGVPVEVEIKEKE